MVKQMIVISIMLASNLAAGDELKRYHFKGFNSVGSSGDVDLIVQNARTECRRYMSDWSDSYEVDHFECSKDQCHCDLLFSQTKCHCLGFATYQSEENCEGRIATAGVTATASQYVWWHDAVQKASKMLSESLEPYSIDHHVTGAILEGCSFNKETREATCSAKLEFIDCTDE